MEPKLLGFIEAMELAHILSPLLGEDKEIKTLELVTRALNSLDNEKLSWIFSKFVPNASTMDGIQVVSILVSQLEINKIHQLLSVYHDMVN